MLISFIHRIDAVNFCMCLAILLMITFPNNFPIMNKDSTNHGIWRDITGPFFCQFETAMHVFFVIRQLYILNKHKSSRLGFDKNLSPDEHSRFTIHVVSLLMTLNEA